MYKVCFQIHEHYKVRNQVNTKKSIVGQKLSAKYGYHKEKSKQNQYWKNNDFTKSEDTWSADICKFLSRIHFYKGIVEKGQLRNFFKRFWQIFKKDWHLNWPSSICIIFQRNIHSSFFISSVPHREQKESRWLEKVEEYCKYMILMKARRPHAELKWR